MIVHRGERFLCYLFFLANLGLSNILWIFHWSNNVTIGTPFESDLRNFSEILTDPDASIRTNGKDEISITTTNLANPAPVNELRIQSWVVALHKNDADDFAMRNRFQGSSKQKRGKVKLVDNTSATSIDSRPYDFSTLPVTWFPAANGMDQMVLDEYASLTGHTALNASKFHLLKEKDARLMGYETPHHTGCFMSHYNLLRLSFAGWQALGQRPDALFIFEDDARCISDARERAMELINNLEVNQVPWDMVYIGGKPFSYHNLDPITSSELQNAKNFQKDINRPTFHRFACDGVFGRSSTGPFAPDGSRNLSLDQPYWQTGYITNTHGYVVNPSSVERILDILVDKPKQKFQVPVDIAYAEAIEDGRLRAFIPTMEYCVQGSRNSGQKNKIEKPETSHRKRQELSSWKGLYFHRDLAGRRVDDMFFPECPSKL